MENFTISSALFRNIRFRVSAVIHPHCGVRQHPVHAGFTPQQ